MLLLSSVILFGCGGAQPDSGVGGTTRPQVDLDAQPIDIVNRRMAAYDNHEIQAFMDLYSDEIEIFTYPDKSLGKGKKHLRSIFEPMFREGNVHVEVHGQFTKDSYVVNSETVTDGKNKTEYVSIYEVKNGLIQSVRFVRD